jgi:hypothetical protein
VIDWLAFRVMAVVGLHWGATYPINRNRVQVINRSDRADNHRWFRLAYDGWEIARYV